MPELPEVETARLGLARHLEGEYVQQVRVRRRDLRQPIPRHLEKTLLGKRLISVTRRAKYILCTFDSGDVLLIHLGMSGSVVVTRSQPTLRTHDHVIIEWSKGLFMVFHDPRRFGVMLLANAATIFLHPLIAKLGMEPLTKSLTGKHLHGLLADCRAPIKSAIMDQQRLVGVGNIYACEALFLAGIHPARPAADVTLMECGKLAKAIKNVLNAAIASGGSTLRDYVGASGDTGYFQHHFRVYGKQKQPCEQCHTPLASIRQSGRSTFFCPRCQR